MSDDTPEPQIGGEDHSPDSGRSTLARLQGSTGSGNRFNTQTGEEIETSTGPGKKYGQSGSPSDMNFGVVDKGFDATGGYRTPQNVSKYGNVEDKRNFSSTSDRSKSVAGMDSSHLKERLAASSANPTDRGFMGGVQDWGRKVAARSESGPVEKAADNFISQPQYRESADDKKNQEMWDRTSKPSDSAHATNLEGNVRPTAQNIANELRKEKAPEPQLGGDDAKKGSVNMGNIRVPGTKDQFRHYRDPHEASHAVVNQMSRYEHMFPDHPNTMGAVLKHYSPPNENKTEHLIKQFENRTGIKRDQKLDFSDRATRAKLAYGVATQEGKAREGTQAQFEHMFSHEGEKEHQREIFGHPKAHGDVDKEVAQGKKQFEEKKGESKKEEVTQPGLPAKEPAMTEVKNSDGDSHTDEKLSVYKNLFL